MSDSKAEDTEAQALFRMVRSRYGDRLDADQLDEVREGVDAIVEAAQALRSVKLSNGDEPLSVFTPYLGEGAS
jgi:hypothetical protein